MDFAGEFNHSLKGYKIPMKGHVSGNACDTPAPPGTEDIALQQANANTHQSPLATVYEAPRPKFERLPHSQPQSQKAAAAPVPAINNFDNLKIKKSSSLFSKIIITYNVLLLLLLLSLLMAIRQSC